METVFLLSICTSSRFQIIFEAFGDEKKGPWTREDSIASGLLIESHRMLKNFVVIVRKNQRWFELLHPSCKSYQPIFYLRGKYICFCSYNEAVIR